MQKTFESNGRVEMPGLFGYSANDSRFASFPLPARSLFENSVQFRSERLRQAVRLVVEVLRFAPFTQYDDRGGG
jgi:hypothetical protein